MRRIESIVLTLPLVDRPRDQVLIIRALLRLVNFLAASIASRVIVGNAFSLHFLLAKVEGP